MLFMLFQIYLWPIVLYFPLLHCRQYTDRIKMLLEDYAVERKSR